MRATGDWVVPTLAGEPFMEKPPLFYLTAALFAKIFSAWLPLHDGARLATGFYMTLTLLFTGLAARELYGRATGAILALLACIGLIPLAHLLITDIALLAGLALSLYGLALGTRRTVIGGLFLGTGAGIAFLSKGLLGPGLLFDRIGYSIDEEALHLSSDGLADYYTELLNEYPIIYIEDPFQEDAWDSWKKLYSELSSQGQIFQERIF